MKKSLFILLVTAITFMPLGISEAAKLKPQEKNVLVNTYSENIDFLVGNYTSPIKMIFSDIDGTLLPTDPSMPKGTVPESVKKAVKKLQTYDIPLVLVTGRSTSDAKIIAKKMGLNEVYIIGQQGAVITDEFGSEIYVDGISKKDVDCILRDLKSFNDYYRTDVKPFVYVDGQMYIFKNFKIPYIMDTPILTNNTNSIGKKFIAVKIGLYEPSPKTLLAVQKYLQKRHKKFNIVISAHCFCDVSSKTATKGNAIAKLSEKFGVDLTNIAAFGDSENDISMLRLLKDAGGLPIAVDNALDSVKANSSFVTKSVYSGGFLYGIDTIINNNNLLLP